MNQQVQRSELTSAVIVVTKSQSFYEIGLNALNDIKDRVFEEVIVDSKYDLKINPPFENDVYFEAKSKALLFLNKQNKNIKIVVIHAENLREAEQKIIDTYDKGSFEFQVGMVFYDQVSMGVGNQSPSTIDDQILRFYEGLQENGIPLFYSPYACAVFVERHTGPVRYLPMQYIERVLSDNHELLQTDLLCLWMDFFDNNFSNRRVKAAGIVKSNNCLAEQIIEFLYLNSSGHWLASYYTGSIVSSLIGHFEQYAPNKNGLVLRGPNEHSLSCGAMVNWQLYKTPFAIVVTSGMVDEFKGTLANLREARAKGFIIIAESRPDQWFPFQGTISSDEDTREVLKARRIPYVYMDDVDKMTENLTLAFEQYHENSGPVVLLVTQAVLEASASLDCMVARQVKPPVKAPSVMSGKLKSQLDSVMALINNGPDRVMWQCGPLSEKELELTLEISKQSGIALVDSLIYPGSIPKFHNGRKVDNYLGTLAIYGFSPRVYSYLYNEKGNLHLKDDQCVFFVKSKVSQISSPIPEGRMNRQINVVQVTENDDHIAPFTDIPVNMTCIDFLEYVKNNISIDSSLKSRRKALISGYYDSSSDVVSKLAVQPMSPNYFFSKLNSLIEKLIVTKRYDYTGLYDVGRCGISAVRNVARTRRGFSGWYGRALMGDALLSTISLAHTSPTNVIAFVGDGARGIVPDVLPSFIENSLSHPGMVNKNITIFYFSNGGHSVINFYQEKILLNRTSRQMRLVNIQQQDWEDRFGGLHVVSETIEKFDDIEIEKALTEPCRLNLFNVVVSHNNEGDGITLAAAKGWQRDPALTLHVDELLKKRVMNESPKIDLVEEI